MNTQEILPQPQGMESKSGVENSDSSNEKEQSRRIELKQGPSSKGSAAISGVAVDDASAGVVSAAGVVSTEDIQLRPYAAIGAPIVAEDLELIEKEWVKKAKDIVRATQGDAYQQNNQINKIKAEYIQKRYNKEVKVREE